MTSNAFRQPYNLSDPIGASHYDETYYQKKIQLEEPIRTGTASGTRSNKPHPSKVIMLLNFLICFSNFNEINNLKGVYGFQISAIKNSRRRL